MNLHIQSAKKRTDETDTAEILDGLRQAGEAAFAILLRHPDSKGGEVNKIARALRLLVSHGWNVSKTLEEEVANARKN